jgi:UDP-N-acetyl-alpha-D-muramoyl-L-alanyl-L-glutamate epimerase
MRFDPADYDTFELGSTEWSTSTNTVSLHYGLRGGPAFIEEYRFDGVSLDVGEPARTALLATIDLLHICASSNYYKTASPRFVSFGAARSASPMRALLAALLGPGLAEFRYRNGLDQTNVPVIDAPLDCSACPTALKPTGTPLVPVGGGKDSIATIEALRQNGHRPVLFVLGGHERILDVCDRAGFETVVADRRVDPLLERLNRCGALDGHIPVSAIVSASALIAAICVGSDAIVMSNERSASDPNLDLDGSAVNHQYSKSIDFESVFRWTVRESVSGSIEYFSLLRRSSELRIARYFASLSKYHDVFVSCNHAFGQRGDSFRRWCCACPKCRFLFAVLAPFLGRDEMVGIFGWDLLDDERQIPGYLELLGVARWTKPFECVGDLTETRLALSLAAECSDWRDSAVVDAIRRAAPDALADPSAGVRDAFRLSGDGFIPPRFADCARSIC